MCLESGRIHSKSKPLIVKPLLVILLALTTGGLTLRAAENKTDTPPSESRCDTLTLSSDEKIIRLDSRFVVPGSLRIFFCGRLLSDSLYRLEPVPGLVHLELPPACNKIVACYRAWSSLSFPDSFRLRLEFPDSPKHLPATVDTALVSRPEPLRTSFGGGSISEGFRLAGFDIRGSKSVSVSGGGVAGGKVFDQNLMLEISGKLTADTRLRFRLNDQDLPLMAEGRSAELRQLDEISVMLSSPVGSVSLGDYDFKLSGYRFAEFERKLDGVSGVLKTGGHTLGASAALSGGTFISKRFNGEQGRQGPYQLTGKNGEPVRVLAGTERIYLDGKLLKRGVRNDYVIDYNRGTFSFTDRHLIGPESRIEVDYEYSSFTFKKALYSVTGETRSRLGTIRGYFLRESDLENSPLTGQFTPEEQEYLARIGGELDSLLFSGVRYLGEGLGTYRLRFTGTDEPYFEYVGPGKGDYRVSFREVGRFQGSYGFDPTSGGYKYLGKNLGDFEPAGEVAPPRREDRAGMAVDLHPVQHLRLQGEGALLKRTINLFSGESRPVSTAHSAASRASEVLPLPRGMARAKMSTMRLLYVVLRYSIAIW